MAQPVTGQAPTDQYVLAAYTDGSDLHAVAPALREAFGRFHSGDNWTVGQTLLVDLQHPADPSFPDCLPDWDLGLNLGLGHSLRAPDWFKCVEVLVTFLRNLSQQTGREFVLFLCHRSRPELQEHLCFVGAADIDASWLREAIERLIIRSSNGTS